MSATSVATNLNKILMLNGTNFEEWKENIKIFLGSMYLDLALREPKPSRLANSRSAFDCDHLRMWEHSNRLSLMIIHRGIPEAFRGIVPDEISSAKDYLAEFEKRLFKTIRRKQVSF
ncbi:hypothetical protein QQ045_021553 [Rhodiola kirilowii]